jgi:prepilin-type N-terminal cleavage/methylation domain-containing protein
MPLLEMFAIVSVFNTGGGDHVPGQHRGFSFVEMIVVVAIMLILLGILIAGVIMLVHAVQSLGGQSNFNYISNYHHH